MASKLKCTEPLVLVKVSAAPQPGGATATAGTAIAQMAFRSTSKRGATNPYSHARIASLSATQPNFMAKFFRLAACRSGAKEDTASETIVVR